MIYNISYGIISKNISSYIRISIGSNKSMSGSNNINNTSISIAYSSNTCIINNNGIIRNNNIANEPRK